MSITICDVGPRDGLQNDPKVLEPELRAELVNRLAAAGLPRIEAVSFVNPARVPQMAGAEEVVQAIDRVPGVVYAGLALNDRVGEAVKLGKPGGVHLHNTRSTGFANAYEAIASGATVLDSSVGGIGGCPFAPRATGNIATEDLVYMLHGEGIETGVDLDELIGVAQWLESVLGRQLEGQVYRAGSFAPVAG